MEKTTLSDLILSFKDGFYKHLDVKDLLRDYGDTVIITEGANGESHVKNLTNLGDEIILHLEK